MSARLLSLGLAAVLLSPAFAGEWRPYSEKYTRWQAQRPMIYGAMHNCVPRDHLPERAARFAACNLNTLIWFKPAGGAPMFQAAHDAGLMWACGARGGTDALETAMKIPGCAFVVAGDEPSKPEAVAQIASVSAWTREKHPDVLVFANLSIAEFDHDAYIAQCKPDVFSYDEYPLLRDGRLAETYLYNLAWGRQTASRHNLPYWMFVQAFGREHSKPGYAYRIPGESDLRFLVFTFLAHGGSGVYYFMYYGWPESMVRDTGLKEDPGRAPAAEHKYENTVVTPAWHAARDLGPEVQNLARALLNLRGKSQPLYAGDRGFWGVEKPTYPVYNPVTPIRLSAFEGQGALRSAQVVEGKDMGLMISFFEDEAGEEYFMIVNLAHGANMSKTEGLRRVRLAFDPGVKKIERLNRLTGRVETMDARADGAAAALDIWLEGGTGDLFKWSNDNPWKLRKTP